MTALCKQLMLQPWLPHADFVGDETSEIGFDKADYNWTTVSAIKNSREMLCVCE